MTKTISSSRAAIGIALALLIGSGAAPAVAGGSVLTGEAVASRVAGGELKVKSGPGYEFPVAITLRADGTMEGVSANGYIDAGRWWIRGDVLCHQWNGWFDGQRQCHAVSAEGDSLVLMRPEAKAFDSTTMKLRK